MTVTVLLFAALREAAGVDSVSAELRSSATVGDLLAHLRSAAGIDVRPAQAAVAVNAKYARLDTPLSDGDEVALIPPVAGG